MPYTDLPTRRSLARCDSNSRTSRRSTRVRFEDNESSAGPTSPTSQPKESSPAPALPSQSFAPTHSAAPEWHFPVYHNNYPLNDHGNAQEPVSPNDQGDRRASDDSNATLIADPRRDMGNMSYSSYRHPYDISAPSDAYLGPETPGYPPGLGPPNNAAQNQDTGRGLRHRSPYTENNAEEDVPMRPPLQDRGEGFFANLIDMYNLFGDDEYRDENGEAGKMSRNNSTGSSRPGFDRMESLASFDSQVLDPDDPTITGERKNTLDDPVDLEKNVLKNMSYKARRKERQRMRVEFNITSVLNRQKFLMRLAKALMTFGAPSHRIEAQLLSAARILEIDGEFIHIPGVIICTFGDQDTMTSETHFVKCGGRLHLGSLHTVHQIYRSVVHDEISAKQATVQLDELLAAGPLYNMAIRCLLAFCISALICPLAFGGSLVDMWVAGAGATFLCLMQIGVASKSQLYANVFEVTMTIFISFLARGLSSIRSQIFCYEAISSAGIVGILPGYLILSSSLELASKNIVCGSVKMVYALIYTLFLGFGLQIGSDFYLLFDQTARANLNDWAERMTAVTSIVGTLVSDNSTTLNHLNNGKPLTGIWTFSNTAPFVHEHIVEGCYRPPTFPWYLQPFPWWTQFIIVPVFSIFSSLANMQPLRSLELVVMVVISCISYAANKVADHYIFNRSDVVSAIGAFACGLLGNMYSRRMGGTAFTSMVTGVLFLVPSGLSQVGGLTGRGSGIDIGAAMIAVTTGITVGLFMSQAIVYTFGSRKNAAIFSF